MKRRTFIGGGLALGAGIVPVTLTPGTQATADESVGASPTPPDAKLKMAIVGCGLQGRALINAAMAIDSMKIIAVCDMLPSAMRSAKLYLEYEDEETPISAWGDFDEMLAAEKDKLDGIIIATPDFVHARQAIAAMKVGLHVYLEPMMATNSEEAQELVATSAETKRHLQIGLERRSDPRYQAVTALLQNSTTREMLLGRITHLETQANRRVHGQLEWAERDTMEDAYLARYGYESMEQFRNWKRFSKYTNGPCLSYLTAQLDVFESIFGIAPDELQAMAGLDYYRFGDCHDSLSALMTYRFPEGTVRASNRVWTTTSNGGSLPFEHILGDNGSVQLSPSDEYFRLFAEPGRTKWDELVGRGELKKAQTAVAGEDPNLIKVRETGNVIPYQLTAIRPASLFRLHLENFVDTILGRCSLNSSAESALASHRLAWTIGEAALSGNRIKFIP